MSHLLNLCTMAGLRADYTVEDRGLAIYKKEDPVVIRLILKKNNIKKIRMYIPCLFRIYSNNVEATY